MTQHKPCFEQMNGVTTGELSGTVFLDRNIKKGGAAEIHKLDIV